MIGKLPLIYWDASVPLSYINGIPDRLQHIEPIMNESGSKIQLITSVLSVTEVAYALDAQGNKDLSEETENRIKKLWQADSAIQIVEFYQLIAEDARALMRKAIPKGWSLKPPDAIHLATADRLEVSRFDTYDDRLDKFSEITDTKFQIGRRIASAPHLPLEGPVAATAEAVPPVG